MSTALVADIERLIPVLDDDNSLDGRWAGAGDEEIIAGEMIALATVMDRARRALLKRAAVLIRSGDGPGIVGILSQGAGWSYGMCMRNRQLALALYGVEGRKLVADSLDAGELLVEHAQVVVDAVRATPRPQRDGVEQVLVDTAARVDPTILRRVARHAAVRAREAAEPGALDEAAAEARGLYLATLLDGLVDVRGTLTPAAGEALLAALAPLSVPSGPDDGRRAPQRRHDALEELARMTLAGGKLPDHGGLRPNLTVSVDLDALMSRRGVASLDWTGTASVAEARTTSCDAAVTRVVLDRPPRDSLAAAIADELPPALGGSARQVLDVGRTTRLISPALRKALVARDRGCTHRGCTKSAAFCDAHHIRHWVDGGSTSLDNVRLLCRQHHRYLHRAESVP